MKNLFMILFLSIGVFGFTQESLEQFLVTPTGNPGMWMETLYENETVEPGNVIIMFTNHVEAKEIHKLIVFMLIDSGTMQDGIYYVYDGALWFRRHKEQVNGREIPIFEDLKKMSLDHPFQNDQGSWIMKIGKNYYIFIES